MKTNTRGLFRMGALVVVLATVGALSVSAFSLEPLSSTFDTTPAGRVRTFRVVNTQDAPISVVVRMTTRDHDLTGAEFREPADDQWVIFPRQLFVQPGAVQAVRVQYVGAGDPSRELAFRMIAEQLSVDFSDGGRRSGISIAFRYEGSVYVRPPGSAPSILLTGTTRIFSEAGDFEGLALQFDNRGTSHGIMNDLVVRLTRSNELGEVLDTREFGEDDLTIVGGANVLAGRALREVISLPPAWSEGTISVEFSMDLVE